MKEMSFGRAARHANSRTSQICVLTSTQTVPARLASSWSWNTFERESIRFHQWGKNQ